MDADEIILAPIYTAHEKPIAGIGLDYLNRFFQRRFDERKLKCMSEQSEIIGYLEDSTQSGDVILTIGAGDVCKIGYALADTLRRRETARTAEVDLGRLQQGLSVDELVSDEPMFGEAEDSMFSED